MGERFVTKVERLKDLTNLLLNYPDGLSKAEISRRIGVHRSTVPKDLEDLGYFEPVWEPIEDKLFSINRDNYRPKVALSLNECMALHLAVRLLTTRTDKHYPHAASALRELAKAINVLAPPIGKHMLKSAEILEDDSRLQNPLFIQNLTRLTTAWAANRTIQLCYKKANGDISKLKYHPYYIEPYGIGRSVHVIGLRVGDEKIRTYKIERILTTELLDDRYEIPVGFDSVRMLRNAWGIWYSTEEPTEISLHFNARAAARVRETKWHHSEKLEQQPDGSLIWRAWVDDWREMRPWVRGWGGDVIVVKPDELRLEIEKEVVQLAKNYGFEMVRRDSADA